jgi:hypothetical protein
VGPAGVETAGLNGSGQRADCRRVGLGRAEGPRRAFGEARADQQPRPGSSRPPNGGHCGVL